ncbi:hypothetical protein CDAR_314851 [Caerostris darwini]|uniref:Uncharacterized protein n=1 Tax=Caerostris darwini TaxID=1538125 RepID=A0AAV4TTD5_9ARAC|nr:hypothetical protein CDAR_314851 [Caerostris darwini]
MSEVEVSEDDFYCGSGWFDNEQIVKEGMESFCRKLIMGKVSDIPDSHHNEENVTQEQKQRCQEVSNTDFEICDFDLPTKYRKRTDDAHQGRNKMPGISKDCIGTEALLESPVNSTR